VPGAFRQHGARRPIGRGWSCVLLAVGGLTVGPAGALAASRDVASTSAYVQADYTLVRAIKAHLPTSQARLVGLLGQVRRECPLAAAGSPQDPESTQLSDELIGAMVLNGGRVDLQAVRAFTATVKPLRWSNPALTSTIQAYAGKLRTLSRLAVPPLCADVRAWAAGGFRSLPTGTIRFDSVFMPAWVGAGELPSQLTAYERPQDRALAGRAGRLELLVSEFEARAVETYGELMNALALLP
jgi:hypothetical protein